MTAYEQALEQVRQKTTPSTDQTSPAYNMALNAIRREQGITPTASQLKAEQLTPISTQKQQTVLAKRFEKTYALHPNSTPEELQLALSEVVDYSLKKKDGVWQMPNYHLNPTTGLSEGYSEDPYTGPVEHLYNDNAAAPGVFKTGIGAKGFIPRYDPNSPEAQAITNSDGWKYAKNRDGSYKNQNPDGTIKPYGWRPGPLGVTPQDGAQLDIALPSNAAKRFEYGLHSNIGQIRNRAIGEGPVSPEDAAAYGSGKTEYTTDKAPLYNIDYVDPGTPLAEGTSLPTPPRLYAEAPINPTVNPSSGNKYLDMAQGSLVSTGVKALGMVQKLIGPEHTATGEIIVKDIYKSFGGKDDISWLVDSNNTIKSTGKKLSDYKDINVAMEEFGVSPEEIQKHNVAMKIAESKWENAKTTGDYLEAAVLGFTQLPEALATSAGEMLPLAAGGYLKGAAKLFAPAVLAATRISEYSERYKKANGVDMPPEKLAGAFAWELGNLVPEMLLAKAGIKTLLGRFAGGEGKIAEFAKKYKKTAAVGGIVGTGFGEGLQELSEGVSEDYATQKEGAKTIPELLVEPKNTFGAVMGFGAGSSLKAGATAIGAVIPNNDKRNALDARIQELEKQVKNKESEKLTKGLKKQQKQDRKVVNDLLTTVNSVDVHTLPDVLKSLAKLDLVNDSEALATETKVQQAVSKKLAAKTVDATKIKLGSEAEAKAFIEDAYIYASDPDNARLNENMRNIGRKYGFTDEAVREIKTAAIVEKEVTVGPKGYRTYEKLLARLESDPEGNAKIKSTIGNRVQHLLSTQIDRKDRIEKAVAKIKADLTSGVKVPSQVKVALATREAPYIINVSNGKISADTIGGINVRGEKVEGVIAAIDRTIKNTKGILKAYGFTDVKPESIYTKTEDSLVVPAHLPKNKATAVTNTKAIVKRLSAAIKNQETVFTPMGSKRAGADRLLIASIGRLKKAGYVEVNKNGHPTVNSGIWVPESLKKYDVKEDEKRATEKAEKKTEAEIEKLAEKLAGKDVGALTTEELALQLNAKVIKRTKEKKAAEKLKNALLKKATAKSNLKIYIQSATDKDPLAEEVQTAKEELTEIEAELAELLDNQIAKDILENSFSKTLEDTDTPIGYATGDFVEGKNESVKIKFRQPIYIDEYLQVSDTQEGTILGSRKPGEVLDKDQVKAIGAFKDDLEAVLAKIDKSKDESGNIQERLSILSSPARGLVFNKEEGINDNVAAAMYTAMNEYFFTGAANLSKKDREGVKRLIGQNLVSMEAMEFFQDVGGYTKNAAYDIGKTTLRLLGYTAKSTTPQELSAKLVADLGQMAIRVAMKQGFIKENDVFLLEHNKALFGEIGPEVDNINPKITVPFIKWTEKGEKALKEKLFKTVFADLKETLDISEKNFKGPLLEPLTKTDLKIRNNPITTQSTKANKVLNGLRNTKFVAVDSALEWLTEEANRDMARIHLGYVKEKELKLMDFTGRAAQEAINSVIDSSLDALVDLKDSDLSTGMYFDWFYARNGRYLLDSPMLNPQADKLHRFMIVPETHNVELSKADKEHMKLFHLAIAQAFGMGTDKKTTTEVQDFGKKVLAHTDTELMTMLENNNFADGIKVGHLGHYLHGVAAVKAYRVVAKNGKFETTLSGEFDATTSGFGLKILQSPILIDGSEEIDYTNMSVENEAEAAYKTSTKWAKKAGIFIGGTDYTSMNDYVSARDEKNSKINLDSYETLASEVKVGALTEEKLSEMVDTIYKGSGKTMWEQYSLHDKAIDHMLFQNTLPTIDDATSEVSKELRNLFKYPFMIFNYGGGISAIRRRIASALVTDTLAKIADPKKQPVADQLFINKLKQVYGDDLVKLVREQHPKNIKAKVKGMPNLEAYLMHQSLFSFGLLADISLNKHFGKFVDANENINYLFTEIFLKYQEEYETKKEAIETTQGRGLTKSEDLQIITSLRDKFPLISGPYTEDLEGYTDTVAIFDTENIASKTVDRNYGTVSTKLSTGSKKVQSKIKALKAAVKAGAVVPIHYIDGAIMGNTITEFNGKLNAIHDALIPPLLEAPTIVKAYNKNVINVNKGYSVIDALLATVDRVGLDSDNETTMEAIDALKRTQEIANINRKRMFGEKIDVMHMSAMPGSKFEYNGSTNRSNYTYTLDQVKRIETFINTSKEAQAILKKANIKLDLEGCK